MNIFYIYTNELYFFKARIKKASMLIVCIDIIIASDYTKSQIFSSDSVQNVT